MNDNDEIAVTMWRALEKADTPEAGGIVLAKASTEAISKIPRPAAAGGWFPCRTGCFSSEYGLRQPEPNGWPGRGEKSVTRATAGLALTAALPTSAGRGSAA